MIDEKNLTPKDNKEELRALLIGVSTPEQTERQTRDYLDELAFLAMTDGITAAATMTQNLDAPKSGSYLGSGKLEECAELIERKKLDLVIVDDELTAVQINSIEKACKVPVRDRTSLILDIFADHARTAYAKTQVELAQYNYMLPRLTRMWTHLDRQRGGGTNMRGPGETQLETDRQLIKRRISKLRDDLTKIDKQKQTQRKNRGALVRVALVGYTNVGKSTIMNSLSNSEVFADNRLFATLDTTVRKVVIKNLPFLLSDTVGFIRKLPTELIESFKSTLDEVREADLLLHVVDISHPAFEDQIAVVSKTLDELLEGEKKPVILVFNKIDNYSYVEKDPDDLTPATQENLSLEDLEKTYMAHMGESDVAFVSAKTGQGMSELKELLYDRAKEIHVTRYPYNDFLY